MPVREKVCILAKSRREATEWAREHDLKRNRWVHPLTTDRVDGVRFSQIVVLPTFNQVRSKHSILAALRRTERKKFVKTKPEWVFETEVDLDKPTGPEPEAPESPADTTPPGASPDGEAPDGKPRYPNEIEGQTDIFDQLDWYDQGGELPGPSEATNTSGEGERVLTPEQDSGAENQDEGTLSDPGSDEGASEGTLSTGVPEDSESAPDLSEFDAADLSQYEQAVADTARDVASVTKKRGAKTGKHPDLSLEAQAKARKAAEDEIADSLDDIFKD